MVRWTGVIGKNKMDTDFFKELEWNEDLFKLNALCNDLWDALPSPETNGPKTEYFHDVLNEAYWKTKHWSMVKSDMIWDHEDWKDLKTLTKKYNLVKEVLFFFTSPNMDENFMPHRHRDDPSAALVFPLIGCDTDSVTSWAHWFDPDKQQKIDLYNYFMERPDNTPFPEDEIATSFSLTDKPALFNIRQFHQVINKSQKLRAIAHIQVNKNNWEDCLADFN